MLRYLLLGLILIHGLIHLLGFVKAFHLTEVNQLTSPIGKGTGVLWLLTTLLLLAAAGALLLGQGAWSALALLGVLLSQILIFTAWSDAKFGTLANVILLVVAIAGLGAWRFANSYRADVRSSLERQESLPAPGLVTEADLAPLPPPVRRYLRYAGAVGQPRIRNMRVTFRGEMRDREQDWFSFTSEQYSFFDEPERFFFMRARVKGLPTAGYHVYQDGSAGMHIKVLSLFPVVDLSNDTLRRAETVTWFNDLCILAPGALIDPRITWEASDTLSARARYTTPDGVSITATLHFDEAGRLVDFVSDDRYDISTRQQLRFSTPLAQYRDFGELQLTGYGEAVWHYPEGKFAYGRFTLQDVCYNVDAI